MTSAVVITASLGILLGSAGAASAQIPHDKFPTQALCQETGGYLVSSGSAKHYSCVHHASAPSNQRWWLYVI
jgi:hypothetical protein